jgi:hypothetical protein
MFFAIAICFFLVLAGTQGERLDLTSTVVIVASPSPGSRLAVYADVMVAAVARRAFPASWTVASHAEPECVVPAPWRRIIVVDI